MSKAQKTKNRIIEGAIALYNDKGYTNVKIRDIAERLDISPGNITYHFSTNKILMNAIYDYMITNIKEISLGDQILISRGKGMEAPRLYLEQVSRFRFFYKDIISIINSYPEIATKHQRMVNRQIEVIESLLFISVGKGYFRPEEIEGMYKTLSEAITNTLHFWLTRQATKGKKEDDLEGALDHISKLIYPYYTQKGLEVYFPDLKRIN
ncbi:hypothetical protein WH52_10990 [Tenacibaculum holothuriorum]|uniref:HTH tetR-type domain-containing protein n=1 Tax=Tenacibaculum holothuriorum TaxID=1635173 RepID=A0A1Y2PCD3_9FLAO|nr:TetR/AcrR family transcriptional regulator [Tenacibaculum holothuriorum]OSY87399.1 hypothetical protein WH52_10990 [Tenacibaculum holothuriorum]